MAFNIHQQILDIDGMPLEKKSGQYQEQLIQLFARSPEGQALAHEGHSIGWTGMLLDFGINYLGVAPPRMSPGDMREILFDLFPRKVSASSEKAPEIIHEFRAFWTFLQREFHLENAAACLQVLDEKASRELQKKMNDPSMFGMAKSFVMMGMERGFDLSSEEGVNTWMTTYQAEFLAGSGLPVSLPGERSPQPQQFRTKLHSGKAKQKRKKNRKKR